MPLKIRKLFEPRKTMGYAIEDPTTGHFFDFASRTFDPNPDNSIGELIEDWLARPSPEARFLRGAYANVNAAAAQLDTPTDVFHTGAYFVYYIDRGDVDRAVLIETWVAEKIGDMIELRPQEAIPTPVPIVNVGLPAAPPAPAPVPSTGPTYNINLPSDFKLGGDLKIAVDVPLPPAGGDPAGPTDGPVPQLPPPPPAPETDPGAPPPDQMPQPDVPIVAPQAARAPVAAVPSAPASATTSRPVPAPPPRRPAPGGRGPRK
jgi:hypothetical protein